MPVFGFKDAGFEVSTESLGTLRFHRVTPEYAERIKKADFQHDLPPNAFLSLLLVTLGTRDDGRPILIEEAYGLSEGEREAFVHAFLNEHGEYYRERIVEERLSARGEKVTRSFLGDRIANPRQPDEDPAAYLTRLYRDFTAGVSMTQPRPPEPVPAPLPQAPQLAADVAAGGDRFADSLLKNAALSESLGKSLAQMKMLETKDGEPLAESAPVAESAGEGTLPAADAVAAPNVSSEAAPVPTPELTVEPVAAPAPPPSETAIAASQADSDSLRLNVPAPSSSVASADPMHELNESVRRSLEDLAKIAHRNTRLIRSTRRIAIFALLLSLLLPLVPVGYLVWRDGFGEQTINKLLLKRSDQLTEQQKQQSDALKALGDEVRSLRTQPPPRRLAD
jgi:hypothetical protein